MAYNVKIDYSKEIKKAIEAGKPQETIDRLRQSRSEKIADASKEDLARWNIDAAGRSLKNPEYVASPSSLGKVQMATLAVQDCKNDITITNPDGTTKQVTGYVLNGRAYVLNENGSGTRLVNYDGNGGIIDVSTIESKDWTYDRHTEEFTANGNTVSVNYKGSVEIVLKDNSTSEYTVSYSYPPSPCPPPPPPFIAFNEQPPTLSSDLKKVNKYSYFFGLDKLAIKNASVNQTCCFVSQDIPLGEMTEDGYIQFEADFSTENNASAEFYIIDGSKEIPILPVNQELVLNEKIFFGLTTRFAINNSKSYEIKRNGTIVDITLDKAVQSSDALYTITYTPTSSFNYKPLNNSIKIKVILRVYDKDANSPHVTKMKIRKFGGVTLWKQDMSVL